ncbi:MAG: GerAB/ArcD/ProY family transporter [Candidatus Faecivicinus sp.]
MKLQISDNAACSLAKLAIAARAVYGIVIDMPELLNAGWISILLGGLLAVPLALALSMLLKNEKAAPVERLQNKAALPFRLVCAVFFAISAYDAAVVAAAIGNSASFMALSDVAPVYLLLPLLAICLACLRLNGNAIGMSASIWSKALVWLLLLVILLEARNYQVEWLTPVLGPGIPALLDGAVRSAGWFGLSSALFLVAAPDERDPKDHLCPLKALGTSVGFAALVSLMYSMLCPATLDGNLFSRSFRLDTLLANGRTGLSLQFPTNILWYISLIYTLLFDVFTSTIMLQAALPRLGNRICALFALIAISLLAVSRLSGRTPGLMAAGWLFCAEGALTALLIAAIICSKGRTRHA